MGTSTSHALWNGASTVSAVARLVSFILTAAYLFMGEFLIAAAWLITFILTSKVISPVVDRRSRETR